MLPKEWDRLDTAMVLGKSVGICKTVICKSVRCSSRQSLITLYVENLIALEVNKLCSDSYLNTLWGHF